MYIVNRLNLLPLIALCIIECIIAGHLLDAFFVSRSVMNVVQLSGAGILAVGLWTFFDKQWLVGILSSRQEFVDVFLVLMYSLIGIGGFVILVTFTVGCCATVSRSRPCLMLVCISCLIVNNINSNTCALSNSSAVISFIS